MEKPRPHRSGGNNPVAPVDPSIFRLADSSDAMICVIDAEQQSIHFNQRWRSFTGHTLEEERAGGLTTSVHPDDLGRLLEACRPSQDTLNAFPLHFRLRHHQGEYHQVRGIGVHRRDPSGRSQGCICCCIDAETGDQHQLNEFIQISGDAWLEITLSGHIRNWNPAAGQLFGYSDGEPAEHPMSLFDLDRRTTELKRILAQLARGDSVKQFELGLRKRDGRSLMVSLSAIPIRDVAGTVAGAFCFIRDLSEQKRLFYALRQSERRFRSLADRYTVPLLIYDRSLRLRYANPRARQCFNIDAQAGIVETEQELLAANAPPTYYTALEQAIETHSPQVAEYLINLPDSMQPVTMTCIPLVDQHDEVDQVLSIIDGIKPPHFDATHGGTLQREPEGISHLHQEMIHLARVIMLGQLAAAFAHELNQPLTAILSNAQAALRLLDSATLDRQELHDILVDIVADDQRAGDIIRRLRALFQNSGTLDFQPLDISTLVQEVIQLVRSDLVLKNIRLVFEPTPNLPRLHGDRIELQQVVLNLILNAIEAMAKIPAAQRQLIIHTSQPDPQTVEVAVEDHGVGLPPDQLERIFDPFVSSKSEGMGMGLAISRTIIQYHGGRIWATLNPGRGATLRFVLPTYRGTVVHDE